MKLYNTIAENMKDAPWGVNTVYKLIKCSTHIHAHFVFLIGRAAIDKCTCEA